MAEYIDREEFLKSVLTVGIGKTIIEYSESDIGYMIRKQPTADVVPVKHGRWVDHCVRDWHCSECGEEINKIRHVDGYCYDDKPTYCPNCGAKMDLEG